MSSFHHHIDDPEKHFLGNLLSEDDSFTFHTSNSTGASHSPAKVIDTPSIVGSVSGTSSSFWPEPPPAYSPPAPLGGTTWKVEPPPCPFNRLVENPIDDWTSFLYTNSHQQPPYEFTREPSSCSVQDHDVPVAPGSAPVKSSNPLPFSYRDVVNRGVSQSMSNFGHSSSSSSIVKDDERGGKIEDNRKNERDDTNDTNSHYSNNKSEKKSRGSESWKDFQQIVRKKGQQKVPQQQLNGKKNSSMKRSIQVTDVIDPPYIEDSSRFKILEKLPVRKSNGSTSNNDDEHNQNKSPSSNINKIDKKMNGGINTNNQNKKKWNRGEDTNHREILIQNVTLILNYIKLAVLWIGWIAEKTFSYVVELTIDVAVKCCAIAKFGFDHGIGRLRTFIHEYRGRLISWWNRRKKKNGLFNNYSLQHNIRLPETPEDALDRLLNARGQDAYSVLGVRNDASDEDIRSYYKKQALLVHPDKNDMDGAAEAFQILSKAFEAIGTFEGRKKYDMEKMSTSPLQAEIAELYRNLRQKVEETRNRMECDCGGTHIRVVSKLSQQAARLCRKCQTRHPAKNLDIWAESRFFGMCWVYYTCVNGVVYDITSWANCKSNQLKHMKADSHSVIYRMLTTQQNREARQAADRYLKMLSEGLEKASKMHVSLSNTQASLQPLEREEERPRRAKRGLKKK